MDHKYIPYIYIIILLIGFGLVAFKQLRHQPFYSIVINNYKFGIYFSYSIFSMILILVISTNLSNSQFFADISPILIIILFGVGYKINNIYHNRCLRRIYKKFHEKETINNLRKSISKNELKYNTGELKKKKIYNSIERISMYIIFFFY